MTADIPTTDRVSSGRWHVLSRKDVLGWLDATPHGLSSAEVAARLERYDRNELPTAGSASALAVLGRQFTSPLIGILVVTFAITLVQGHWVDAGAIGLVLALNAGIGFWQERKAETAVRALQRMSVPVCRVRRDGSEREMAAAGLVPGDVVQLQSGERVPADLRLLGVNGLQVDESMLTGEALPVAKQVSRLPVQTLERRIGIVIAVASLAILLAGLVLGYGVSTMFRTAVAVAVASVPESLPIVLTVAMSLGVALMARRNAIVRSLPAVETLGSTTVIGSDRTGTLTRNELTVEFVWTASGVLDLRAAGTAPRLQATVRRTLHAGALTNEAHRAPAGATTSAGEPLDFTGDAVDVAMLRAAVHTGAVTTEERDARWVAHTPYEPELRLPDGADDTRRAPGPLREGPPEALAAVSTTMATDAGDRPFDPEPVEAANDELARQGMRVLARAMRVLDPEEPMPRRLPRPSALTFLGLEGMEDPPRPGWGSAPGRRP